MSYAPDFADHRRTRVHDRDFKAEVTITATAVIDVEAYDEEAAHQGAHDMIREMFPEIADSDETDVDIRIF